MLLGRELQIDAKNSNFEISESTLSMKSGSMPLMFCAGMSSYLHIHFDTSDIE